MPGKELAINVKVADSESFKKWLQELVVSLEVIKASIKKFKADFPDLYDKYFENVNINLDLDYEEKTKPKS